MKKFIIINGAMGVGKTSICKELNKKLINSAWLDGDWCMMMNPLNFTETNQKMFLDNIYHLLNNYLSNPSFEYVLFSWVIPREEMINYIIKKLSDNCFELVRVTLLCADIKLKERMLQAGRDEATIEKSMLYQEAFRSINTIKVDTTELSVLETVDEVLRINIRKEDYMLVTVKRKDFKVLNDVSLIWTCIEPIIQQIRSKNFVVKSKVYASLNLGQRALLMFQMLYGHTSQGVEEFYLHLSYLLSNKGVWSQLKKGMQYFGDYDMMQILEKMDIDFQRLKTEEFNETAEQHSVLIDKNAELSASMSLLNKSLSDAFPSTIKLVATYIRNNTGEFVQFID